MTVQIGPYTFDRVRYDPDGDVLALHKGDPTTAVDFDESIEGHGLRFDAAGGLVGITIVGARALLDRRGQIRITIPPPVAQHLDADHDTLDQVLVAA